MGCIIDSNLQTDGIKPVNGNSYKISQIIPINDHYQQPSKQGLSTQISPMFSIKLSNRLHKKTSNPSQRSVKSIDISQGQINAIVTPNKDKYNLSTITNSKYNETNQGSAIKQRHKSYTQKKMQEVINNLNEYLRNRLKQIHQKDTTITYFSALFQLVQSLISQNNKQEAKGLIHKILEKISQMSGTIQISDQAYMYGLLAQIQAQISYKYQQYLEKACEMYDKYPEYYVQNKIALINNVAIAVRSSKRQGFAKQSIKLFQKVIDLQMKYYTMKDERTYYSRINLACTYCEDLNKVGAQLFVQLIRQLQAQKSPQFLKIKQLAESNYKSYCQ